jgi:hypothetical protein
MSNLYQSPESNIKTDKSNPDRRIGWKMFFLIMLILELLGFYFIYESILDETVKTVDIVALFVYPFMVLALFGYAFKKAFFHQLVWKIFFPISLVVDLWGLFQVFGEDPELNSGIVAIIVIAVITPIILLQYLVLYRYGFTNRAPWDKRGVP